VNVNAASFSVGTVTFTQLFASGAASFTATSGNADGFGSFNLTLDNHDGFTSSVTAASFQITDTSGTWADSGSVLTGNSNGFHAAAHLFPDNTDNPGTNDNVAQTVFVTEGSSPPSVPAPASFLLALTGVVGLGLTRFRRLLRKQPLAA
jgi:hypothetical protein